MIVVDAYRAVGMDYTYTMFDQYTNSCRRADEAEVLDLIKRGIEFSNIEENFGSLYIANGYNRVERFSSDGKIKVVSANMCGKWYKVTSAYGHTEYKSIKELLGMANENILYNCRINNGKLEFIDEYIQKTTYEFKNEIDEKYKKFIAKSKLVGLDSRFEYSVEGDNVILQQYTGESEKFIAPRFITSLSSEAFQYSYMRSVELNNGLRFIGANAFAGCKLSSIRIPSSVEYIWVNAFEDNEQLFTSRFTTRVCKEILDMNKINIENENMIFL